MGIDMELFETQQIRMDVERDIERCTRKGKQPSQPTRQKTPKMQRNTLTDKSQMIFDDNHVSQSYRATTYKLRNSLDEGSGGMEAMHTSFETEMQANGMEFSDEDEELSDSDSKSIRSTQTKSKRRKPKKTRTMQKDA